MLIDEIKKREISIFEAFAVGRVVYGKTAKIIFEIVLILGIPITLLILGLSGAMNSAVEGFDLMAIISDGRLLEKFIETQAGKQFYIFILLNMISYVVFLPLISLSVALVAKNFLQEEPMGVFDVLGKVMSKSHIIIPATILNSLLVFIWMGFAAIQGLQPLMIMSGFVHVYLMFYECAIILDDKGIVGSLKHSVYLVKGRAIVIILFAMLLFGVNNSVSYLLSMVFSIFEDSMFTNVCMNIMSMFLSAYFNVVLAVYYISRQSEKEREEQRKLNEQG